MNKKELNELKKQYKPEKSTIGRIAGCYVDGDKNIRLKTLESFFSLPEEAEFKYFEIFKKSMSGSLGSNLFTMEFDLDAELSGGHHDLLMKLRETELKDQELLDLFFEKVVSSYDYGENYYIILVHINYDVPGKATDGTTMEDASDTVFSYLHCCICPVELSKSALGYDPETNAFAERVRDWIVSMPMTGFIFPAFHDRATDIHNILYYSKNTKEIHPEFINDVLGSHMAVSSHVQKQAFTDLVTDTLRDSCEFDTIKTIHENIREVLKLNEDNPDPVLLTKDEIKQIFYDSGVSDDSMERFDTEYEASAGNDTELMANNLAGQKKFTIEAPDIVIKVNPDRTDLIESRIIDGRQCLVIAVDSHLEVNGIDVRTIVSTNEEE